MGPSSQQSFTGLLIGGRYRLGRELGRGGMGAVYEAVQENLGRRVAVKIVRQELAEEPEVLERFRREAQAAASLGHPNIVQVTDFGHHAGAPPFLVMERLQGESLRGRLQREGTQDPAVVISIALQMLSALSAAHQAGIVHRDLKPDNVFLVDMEGVGSVAKLLDFGIAKLAESKGYARLTSTGVIIGTPTYMAPEQMSGAAVDARTDIYSLGVVMYRALAGRPPFSGPSPADVLRAILEGKGAPLAERRPDLDPRLLQITARAMGHLPSMRFDSADDMRTALAPLIKIHSVRPAASNTPASQAAQNAPTAAIHKGVAAATAPTVLSAHHNAPVLHSSFDSPPTVHGSLAPPAPARPALPSLMPPGSPVGPTTPASDKARRVQIAVIGALGVAVVALIGWIALTREDTGVAPNISGSVADSSSGGMPSLGAITPAAEDASLRIDIVGVYSMHYRALADLEPALRTAASTALSCLDRAGYHGTSRMPFVWVFSVDPLGQYLASSASEPDGNTVVQDCMAYGAQTAHFSPPPNNGPTGFGVRVRIVAN